MFQLGLVFQRSLILSLIFASFIVPLFLNAEWVFLLVNKSSKLSSDAAKYERYFILGLIAVFVYNNLYRLLLVQSRNWAIAFFNVTFLALVCVLNYVFMIKLSLGIEAGAMAASAGLVIMNSALATYIWTGGRAKDIWPGWQSKAWLNWREHAMLGLSGISTAAITYAEIDGMVYATSLLGKEALAAQVLLSQLMRPGGEISLALNTVAINRIGLHLGAGSPSMAKLSSFIYAGLFTISSLLVCMFLIPVSSFAISKSLTSPTSIDIASTTVYFIAARQVLFAIEMSFRATLSGCGKQVLIAKNIYHR